MIISEFGYQRAVTQVERVNELCRVASVRSKNPQVLRDLRQINSEAGVIKAILSEYVKPDAVKAKRSAATPIESDIETGGDDPLAS